MLFYKSTKTIKNNKLTTVATLLFSALFLSAPAVAGTAWEQTTATSNNYDFAINDGSGSTQYYNINLKNFDNITWSTGSADPSWNEQTGTATGSISFTIPHVTGDSSVKNYVYQYTLPSGYTETETRYANESRTGAEEATLAVNNKLFFNIHETEQGGAILLKVDKNSSPFSYTDTIKSDFINNFTSHTYGGGAVAISGKTIITSIIGNFIGNVSSAENAGALNIGTSQTIDNIIGNFIANRSEGTTTTSSSSIGGGAIYTKDGDRNSITGDFIGNSAVKNAGAIYHTSKTIGTITGDFIANVAGENGGAIYTYANSTAKINNIIGDFINNQAGGSGGAIYVGGGATYGSIRGSFLGNIAASYGGAIYVNSNANISIDATDKNIVFYNNKAGENYSDIYNNGGTISLNAATGQKISFGGTLRAASGTININNKDGVQGGTYVFNNTISKNSVNLYNGAKLILGKITQTNGDTTYGNFDRIASLTTDNNGGEIDQRNEHIDSNTIDTVTLGTGGLKYSIDIDGTTKTADKITTSESTTSSGIITLEAINLIGGFESLTPEDVIQIINNKNASSTLKLQLGSDLQGDVLLKTIEGSTTDETITSTTAWNKIYQRTIISDTEIYGQIALKTKVTENDSIGITTYTSGGEESTESMGDTLKLVNQDTTNATKDFTATTDGDSYTVTEDLGATKGTININGVSGGDAETINLDGHSGFQVGEDATALNFNNVTVGGASTIATITNGNATVGINNSIINGSIIGDTVFNMTTSGTSELNGTFTNAYITNTGNLTTNNSTIDSSVVNSGTINLVNSIINGDITNNGTLNLNGTAIENAISSTNNAGIINVNSDWTIANTVSGNTININNSTLKVGSNYLDNTDTINANNSTIDIGANTVNLKSMQLDSSSTLSLKINGLEDGQHGLLNISDNITINDGAKLTATLAQGIKAGEVTLIKADSHTGDFADEDVTHTEEGIDIAENNMYKFIKTDKFGVFSILKKSTAEDIVKEQGARAWVADAARAWVDEQPFDQGSSSAIVADKLAGLAQHDAAGLIRNLKALAPTETTVVQNTVSEKNSILFRAVDSYLRRAKEFSGISTDVETTGINAWAKPYTNNSKIYNRNGIDGSNSDSHGIIFGLEKELGSIYKLGAGVQIDRTDIDAMSRDIDVNSVTGFIYGEYKPNRYFINGIISYEQSNYKEKKYALDDIYNARYDVWVASIASMAGYQFEYLTPEAGFRYYHIKRDRYTDTAGQKVSAADTDILRGIISLRFAREIYNIKSEAYFGLTYDFMTDKNNTHVNLANGSSYTVSGSKLPRLGYETILSLEKSLTENTSAGLTYMGAYRSGYQEHTGMLNFRYEFE